MAILLNTVHGLGPQDDIGKGNWVWVLCLGEYERFSDMWVEIPVILLNNYWSQI